MGAGTILIRSDVPAVSAICGQDIVITDFAQLVFYQLTCPQFNGTLAICDVPQQLRGFKDGVEITEFTGTVFSCSPNPNLCGTCTF